jgi:hypothetical protein
MVKRKEKNREKRKPKKAETPTQNINRPLEEQNYPR